MSLVQTVHPCEAIVNRLASIQDRAAESVRDSRLGLAGGLLLSALAGAPMPLPQMSLAGPILATLAAGKLGGRAAAAVGFVSYLVFDRPTAGVAMAAGAVACLVGWAVPFLLERTGAIEDPKRDASAIVIDCDGFASLDATYGEGASAHAFSLLRRALDTETRESDFVVHAQGQELILVLDGSNAEVAQAVMARVERRFSAWLSDAGYECNLSVGLGDLESGFPDSENALRSRSHGPYLD